jgi:hypothetical protein
MHACTSTCTYLPKLSICTAYVQAVASQLMDSLTASVILIDSGESELTGSDCILVPSVGLHSLRGQQCRRICVQKRKEKRIL